jgi:hypothetical protein
MKTKSEYPRPKKWMNYKEYKAWKRRKYLFENPDAYDEMIKDRNLRKRQNASRNFKRFK